METVFRDRLPKGLSYPIGLEALAANVVPLVTANAAVLFAWHSTWAPQIFDPVTGRDGRLPILRVDPSRPFMRVGNEKVKEPPADCLAYVVEYAVASTLRRRVLDGFVAQGAALTSQSVLRNPASPFILYFSVESGAWVVDAPQFF